MAEFKLLLSGEEEQAQLKSVLPQGKILQALADFFSIFSDKTRIKIMSALALSEMCVNDLSILLELNQTTLSHQLQLLRHQNLVECRKDGKIAYYTVSNYVINDLMISGAEYILNKC
ncbi:MAG: metalloregulator ArsR/SmtB family transcription factor [Bacilli bacterium]